MTTKQVLALIAQKKIEFVDFRFMDFPGMWQHKMFAASEITPDAFEHGLGFDGSCVRGWEAINEADMLLVPVAATARIDPFYDRPTLAVICDVKDPVTKKTYSRDPRSVARRAVQYMVDAKVADQAMFSPEIEFFVFDSAQYDQTTNAGGYRVDSIEGQWNRGLPDASNKGRQLRVHEGVFPSPPADTLSNLRSEMALVMGQMGIDVAPSCPSRCLTTTVPGCTPTSPSGKMAAHLMPVISTPV
jgi:glutamine synthetase